MWKQAVHCETGKKKKQREREHMKHREKFIEVEKATELSE
jgi:hypothetical protein